MNASPNELTVFPTELSMRRFQQEKALEEGCIDASKQTTFSRLQQSCLPFLAIKTTPLSSAQELLLCRKVVTVARTHFEKGPLKNLTDSALVDLLKQLILEIAVFPDATQAILDWFLHHPPNTKPRQLGILLYLWRDTLKQEGWADRRDLNAATLKLFRGNPTAWPPLLRNVKTLIFTSVRWFNPFEESCLLALNKKLKINIEMALPPAHSEKTADRLGLHICSETMTRPWENWIEDLADALVTDSSELVQFSDAHRVLFSHSVGAYGEIEDLARRIAWKMEHEKIPAHQIALVIPNLSTVQDIVPHVFSRFNIPYYFRRGRPVLSSPLLKAFLAWVAFPLHAQRDVLIDLYRNPALKIRHRETAIQELQKHPPRITYLPAGMVKKEGCTPQELLTILDEKVLLPEDDHFNTAAIKTMITTLESMQTQRLPLFDLLELLEKLLENETIRPRDSHDQGVWVINPYDAIGLQFNLVLFASLNDGEFPAIPQQDPLLNDYERNRLRTTLKEKKHPLPKLFLPSTDLLLEQQHILFLGALGMTTHEVVFSCQTVDQEGKEKSGSEYYRKLWRIAGWPAQKQITLSKYDQWRINQLPDHAALPQHIKIQKAKKPTDRQPMLGESFLSTLPLPLCRAEDEALQTAVQTQAPPTAPDTSKNHTFNSLIKRLQIEAERLQFLETPIEKRTPSIYSGFLGTAQKIATQWLEKQKALSPTALELLAHCRYLFFVKKILQINEAKIADDAPNPMDRGGLIHKILATIYETFATQSNRWAIQTQSGWKLRSEGGINAQPLVHFLPEKHNTYIQQAEKIARSILSQNKTPMLGAPRIWEAEQEKIIQIILNFIQYDLETCNKENRYPALFELHFENETALSLPPIHVKGIIDRVDLIFEETGDLKKIRVLDYKGPSRARTTTEEYIEEIQQNLDCQLPIYALAAQQHLFGTFNTSNLNTLTEAGYLFYQRKYKNLPPSLKKSLISFEDPNLIPTFLATLKNNINAIQQGNFATDPLIASYTDFTSLCRTEPTPQDQLES